MELYYDRKRIWFSSHALKQARVRNVAYPGLVRNAILHGKVYRYGKHGITFVARSKRRGLIICVGEDIGDHIIIKTIERGN